MRLNAACSVVLASVMHPAFASCVQSAALLTTCPTPRRECTSTSFQTKPALRRRRQLPSSTWNHIRCWKNSKRRWLVPSRTNGTWNTLNSTGGRTNAAVLATTHNISVCDMYSYYRFEIINHSIKSKLYSTNFRIDLIQSINYGTQLLKSRHRNCRYFLILTPQYSHSILNLLSFISIWNTPISLFVYPKP